MKQKKCILVVDDKPQTAVIKSITTRLSNDFDLDFIPIRTADAKLKKDNSEELDIGKLKNQIKERIQLKRVDIALTDFDLECGDDFTGLNVIHMVREIRPKLKFFIYSGNWNKVIANVVGKEHNEATIDELVEGINKLIKAQIIDCIDRTDYQERLIEYLQKEQNDSVEQRLIKLLRSNKDFIFQSCYPEFQEKSFGEIADIIENNSDARSEEWIDAILSQTIAYLTTVNHE